MSYTGKLASYEGKFENIAKKFKKILDLNAENAKDEVFAKSLLNPNKALLDSEKQEISDFVRSACKSGLHKEVKECVSAEKEIDSTVNMLLITKIKELVEGGVVDVSAYQDRQMSYEEQVEHLVELLESAEESILYSKKYPAITEMNTAVRELREAIFSLKSEFKNSHTKEEFGADAGQVRNSFDSDFKKTTEVLKDVWGSEEDQNTELAVYSSAPVSIYNPDLHQNPRIDSKEAIENLDTKASGHFIGAVGTMQVAYFKDIALPHLVKGVCKLANTNTDLSSQIQDHVAFQKAKYVMANFKAIFRGMESDYSADIEKAYEDMQDIRVKTEGVSSYDLDSFFSGVNRVIKIVSFAEQQHEGFKSNIESIADLCPELNFGNSVPLLGVVSSESASEAIVHDEV